MKATDIQVGDTLRLKPDNAYGMGPALKTVTAITTKGSYRTPWIWAGTEAFKPSDFSSRVSTTT